MGFERTRRQLGMRDRSGRAIRRVLDPRRNAPDQRIAESEPASAAAEADRPAWDDPHSRYRRLLDRAASALGVDLQEGPGDGRLVLEAIRSAVGQASLARSLSQGSSIDESFSDAVRAMMGEGDWHTARALADGIGRAGLVNTSLLCLGLVANHREWHQLAVDQWQRVPDGLLVEHAILEAVESHLADSRADSRSRALRLASILESHEDDHRRIEVASRLLAAGFVEQAARLVNSLSVESSTMDAEHRAVLELIQEAGRSETASPDSSEVRIGILDYRQPDSSRASTNIGDYIQTLAVLGNVARNTNAKFSGPADLVEFVEELQATIPSELRVAHQPAEFHLVPVHRDVSTIQSLDSPVWLLAFGWHMHSLFGLRYDFPYNSSIRPVFFSWHLNRPELLTTEAIRYLRRFGPVGCRDWTTVFILLGAGVDAFFTGCVTSTVDAAVPTVTDIEDLTKVVGAVDAPRRVLGRIKHPYEEATHALESVRSMSVAQGLALAQRTLMGYRAKYRRIVTSRLHSYLPATSLGIPTRFVPRNPSDPRFTGLRDMTPTSSEFAEMRDGIRVLLSEVMSMLASGTDDEDFYRYWRELTAPLVAEARRRHAEPAAARPLHADVDEMVATIRSEAASLNSFSDVEMQPVDVALSCDNRLSEVLPVTIEALTSNASQPLRLWIMTRGLGHDYYAWLADTFAGTAITFLPCDHVQYGDVLRMIKHISLSTMDRLLLPELLTDIRRITYIDVDAYVRGDVAQLASTDLKGYPLAARESWYDGHLWWWKAAMNLEPERADELRRTITFRQTPGYQALNAGILVLDLEAMRRDSFTKTYLPYVEHYGLNDQDVLLAYVGGERLDLDPVWNFWPVMEFATDPQVIHYVGASKPWGPLLTPYDDQWEAAANLVRSRGTWPPPGSY